MTLKIKLIHMLENKAVKSIIEVLLLPKKNYICLGARGFEMTKQCEVLDIITIHHRSHSYYLYFIDTNGMIFLM